MLSSVFLLVMDKELAILTYMVFVFSKLKRSFADHMQNESSVRI